MGNLSEAGEWCSRFFTRWYKYRRRNEALDTFLSNNANLDRHIQTIDTSIKDLNSKVDVLEEKIGILDVRLVAVQKGLKFELFESLRMLWNECVRDQGYATIEQKQEADKIYHVYADELHGNGTGTDLYDEIMNLPTQPVRKSRTKAAKAKEEQ